MVDRKLMHQLVDALPEPRLPAIEQVLRANFQGPVPAAPRRFSSTGTLSAEHDFAERSEDILRLPDEPEDSER